MKSPCRFACALVTGCFLFLAQAGVCQTDCRCAERFTPLRLTDFRCEGQLLYRIILVSGGDAADFLQGQLTQDVGLVRQSECLPAAWCNAQGRVITTLQILAIDQGYGLVVPEGIAEAAIARLHMYRLRSKVTFQLAGAGWQLFATSAEAIRAVAVSDGIWRNDLPSSELGVEIVASTGSAAETVLRSLPRLDEATWKTARIQAGRVDISVANSALYTPHMLNLDLIGAISFSKGCYTGQEIVARTENLGRSKRRTLRYKCEAKDMAIGDTLLDGAAEAGVIVNVSGSDLLAVVPIAKAGSPLQVRGIEAIPQPLPYDIE
jgi:folate-binding protein YgfZ